MQIAPIRINSWSAYFRDLVAKTGNEKYARGSGDPITPKKFSKGFLEQKSK